MEGVEGGNLLRPRINQSSTSDLVPTDLQNAKNVRKFEFRGHGLRIHLKDKLSHLFLFHQNAQFDDLVLRNFKVSIMLKH